MHVLRTLKVFLLIVFLLAAGAAASLDAAASTYYVSPSGSDSNSGSSSAPFRNIQRAADIVNPGDIVIVRDGVYTDADKDGDVVISKRGGTSSKWITYQAENQWGAVLDGKDNSADYCWHSLSAGANYVRIEGFQITGCVKAAIFNMGEHDIVFQGNYVHDIGRVLDDSLYGKEAIYTGPGTAAFVFDSNIFHTIGRLNPFTTPPASEASCTTPPDYVFKGVPYPNLNVCYNHDHALYLQSTNNTIINNIFFDLRSGWAIMSGESGNDIFNNTFVGDNPGRPGQILVKKPNTRILNNIFYGDNDCGIVTYAAECGGRISNNLFYPAIDMRCNTGGYSPRGTWTISNNLMNRNPLFVSPSAFDFHLRSGSPAIDAGVAIPGYVYDAEGNPIVGLPDIGAYEYAGDTADTSPPSVPSGLAATVVSSSRIDLSWAPSTDNVGVAGYKVYREGSLVATVTAPGYADTGLLPSTLYSYRVSAFDAAGNSSSKSSPVSATTLGLPEQPLAVVYPNGGEVLASGGSATITWDAPVDAVSFDLQYTTNGGRTWRVATAGVSGRSYVWQVPLLKRNSTKCRVKVIGYDAAKRRVGSDASDGLYTIQVVRLLSPNGGQVLKATGAVSATISWRTYATRRPVAGVTLLYTTNGGRKWKLIDKIAGNPGRYTWLMPEVAQAKGRCKIAIVLKDADDRTVGLDKSDAYFTMEP